MAAKFFPPTSYKIRVKTSAVYDAGADSNAHLQIHSQHGSSEPYPLIPQGQKYTSSSLYEILTPEMKSLGQLNSVSLWLDETGLDPDWHFEYVEILDIEASKCYRFPCNRWLATYEERGKTRRILICAAVCNEGPGFGGKQREWSQVTLPNDFYEVTPALLGMPQHGFQQPQGAQATLLPKPQGPQISVQNQSQPPPNLVENPIEIPHDGAQQPPEVQTNLIPMLQAAQSPRSHSPERGVYGSPIQWGGNQTWPSVLFLDLPQNPIVAMARESNPNANQDSIGTESVLPDGQMYPPPPLRPPDGFRDR